MSITDELRDWVSNQYRVNRLRGFAIADRIDAEHEKELEEQFNALTIDMEPMTDENMAEHGWIRLPKDGPEAEAAKLRERIARLEQAVEKMVNYDAEDRHLEIWPDCDVPETILITGRDGELEFSPTVLLDKQTSRSRNLMYLFRKTFDALRAVENEYGLDVMAARTPVIAAEAKELGIEVDDG